MFLFHFFDAMLLHVCQSINCAWLPCKSRIGDYICPVYASKCTIWCTYWGDDDRIIRAPALRDFINLSNQNQNNMFACRCSFPPHLFTPSLRRYSAEREGRGQTISQSLSRFKVPFLPRLPLLCTVLHVAALLSCSSHSITSSIPCRKSRSQNIFLAFAC